MRTLSPPKSSQEVAPSAIASFFPLYVRKSQENTMWPSPIDSCQDTKKPFYHLTPPRTESGWGFYTFLLALLGHDAKNKKESSLSPQTESQKGQSQRNPCPQERKTHVSVTHLQGPKNGLDESSVSPNIGEWSMKNTKVNAMKSSSRSKCHVMQLTMEILPYQVLA